MKAQRRNGLSFHPDQRAEKLLRLTIPARPSARAGGRTRQMSDVSTEVNALPAIRPQPLVTLEGRLSAARARNRDRGPSPPRSVGRVRLSRPPQH